MAEATLTDEGPHVFLLSGFGEPTRSDLSNTHASRIKPTSSTNDKRVRWTCWVAIHRPVRTSGRHLQGTAAHEAGQGCTTIIVEFELEHDFQHPLYLPVTGLPTNQPPPPTSGPTTLAVADYVENRIPKIPNAVDHGQSDVDDLMAKPSLQQEDIPKITDPRAHTLTHAGPYEEQIMGLDGEELNVAASDVLESTTSSARPLRALERLRRTKRLQKHIWRDAPLPDRNESISPKPRHDPDTGGIDIMDPLAVLAQINEQFSRASDLDAFHKIVVGVVKELTQFHRCLVYRFDAEWNGLVVAELVDWSKTHDLYNGLQFPSTDIPAQARELYRINKVRLLYDRTQTTARMVLRSKRDLDDPVDMTHCYLRAMSPIHLVSRDVEPKPRGRC
jgi:hypothetical protein